jgi:hypothetical protein
MGKRAKDRDGDRDGDGDGDRAEVAVPETVPV